MEEEIFLKARDNKMEKVKIIPLGGLEQIGMNITAFECRDSIVVVDCGMAFPEDDMLGIDIVLPDVTILRRITVRSRVLLSHTDTRIISERYRMCSVKLMYPFIQRN